MHADADNIWRVGVNKHIPASSCDEYTVFISGLTIALALDGTCAWVKFRSSYHDIGISLKSTEIVDSVDCYHQ